MQKWKKNKVKFYLYRKWEKGKIVNVIKKIIFEFYQKKYLYSYHNFLSKNTNWFLLNNRYFFQSLLLFFYVNKISILLKKMMSLSKFLYENL